MTKTDQKTEEEKAKPEEKKETAAEEWKEKYLRALADYQNLERRTAEQIVSFQKKANQNLLLKFLEVLDDLEKGAVFVKDQGLQLIKDKFVKILKSEGIEEIAVLGTSFDPQTAECIETVKGKKNNIIIEIIRKGYVLDGEILRPARVKVEVKAD